jgi:hydrogenase nickel incorporation protein HypB
MCITCGCAAHGHEDDGHEHRGHEHGDGRDHGHDHDHDRDHEHDHGHCHGHHDHDHAHAHDHPHAHPHERVRVERDVLAKNDAFAARNRARLARSGSLALNLVSSPGSGKTTLLCRTIEAVRGAFPVVVIEGDQQTSLDADRIRATGAPALQINTGKGCHLDASMVERGLARLDPPPGAVVMIENVGNLVCPAAFDLGEHAKVVVLSVTEGEDKPLKYPDMFAAAGLMLINKIDLQPYCNFDLPRALQYARRVNPGIQAIAVSARDGTGFDRWLGWIEAQRAGILLAAHAE